MFKRLFGSKDEKKSDFVLEDEEEDEESPAMKNLRINMTRLIAYAESADVKLQREVAEMLANEAVKPTRQKQIVEYGGLRLLVPLTRSSDVEVQRLAAHCLANISVNSTNQILMAREGAIEMLVDLLSSEHELIQRQAAKALANLGVNTENKRKIALAGGIPRLIRLAAATLLAVKIEAIAVLANLAVSDLNEAEIVSSGGLQPIIAAAAVAAEFIGAGNMRSFSAGRSAKAIDQHDELGAQCARALRNLSVNPENKALIVRLGGLQHLYILVGSSNERISQQARKALENLNAGSTEHNMRK